MKQLTPLEFVADAIERHRASHGCSPRRVEVSPRIYLEMCADGAAQQLMYADRGGVTVRGVPVWQIPGALPRLVRFDGAREDM